MVNNSILHPTHLCKPNTEKKRPNFICLLRNGIEKFCAAVKRVWKFLPSLPPICARQSTMSKSTIFQLNQMSMIRCDVCTFQLMALQNWKKKGNTERKQAAHNASSACISSISFEWNAHTASFWIMCRHLLCIFTVSSVWRIAVYGLGLGCLWKVAVIKRDINM